MHWLDTNSTCPICRDVVFDAEKFTLMAEYIGDIPLDTNAAHRRLAKMMRDWEANRIYAHDIETATRRTIFTIIQFTVYYCKQTMRDHPKLSRIVREKARQAVEKGWREFGQFLDTSSSTPQ